MNDQDTPSKRRRREHSPMFKRELVARSLVPGASVAAVALEAGINSNLLFAWRRMHLSAQERPHAQSQSQPSPMLLPVTIEAAPIAACPAPATAAPRQPEGRSILERLLDQADVLIENFLPGTMEKWGMSYEGWIKERFPRLVHCSISGFGSDGPLGGLPGYDAVLQAMCGLMSINGEPSSGPTRIGVPIVDHLTAYTALTGILLALHSRHTSGTGQRVEATLFDAALSLLVPHAANYFESNNEPGLLGSAHPNIAPYDRFKCRDGEIFLGIMNRGQFERFCAVVDRPGLAADERFLDNARRIAHRQALRQEIERAIGDRPRAALCEALMRAGVPAGPVNSVSEAFAQPHATHRQMAVQRNGYRGIGLPVRLEATAGAAGSSPRPFNADAFGVLRGVGYTAWEIGQLRASAVVPCRFDALTGRAVVSEGPATSAPEPARR